VAVKPGDPFCLLVVAKAPVPGLAKTRLTPPATPRQAAAIAAASLVDTLTAVLGTPGAVPVVAMTGDLNLACDAADLRALLAPMRVVEQRGDDFGDRLANAHADAAALCPGLPVVQIGMDTPQVTPALLADTAALLADDDVVLGAAEDGGWWVLGLRDPLRADALRDVPMSRHDTATRTLAALGRDTNTATPAPTLSDVDDMADAVRVAAAVPSGRFAAAVHQVTRSFEPTDTTVARR
jgi:glycosyltransferase A (GT-A) superfamily protein (DUF2064 family)